MQATLFDSGATRDTPIVATLVSLLRAEVAFDSALKEIKGHIVEVFPPEKTFQNLWIADSPRAAKQDCLVLRVSERDQIPKAFKGGYIHFVGGDRAPRSIIFEQILSAGIPQNRGRVVVRRQARQIQMALPGTAVVTASPANATPPPRVVPPAVVNQRPEPVSVPPPTSGGLAIQWKNALAAANKCAEQLVGSELDYLVSSPDARRQFVVASAGVLLASQCNSAREEAAPRPYLEHLRCCIAARPDCEPAVQTMASTRGFISGSQTWRDLNEEHAKLIAEVFFGHSIAA